MSIDQLVVEGSSVKDRWLPEICYKDHQVTVPDNRTERVQLRKNVAETIFANHLQIIWTNLSKISNIPKPILWENTSIYLFWLDESMLETRFSG
ncbi:hypothetical protein ACE1TI_03210 [Alteribacillus sp. JSM 102045]|uniref:hypothetical protein n=1 Tax=Alteribacillus sp. JSM 102045 TaxID=1562101 RepID=UPI0035C0C9C8